MRFLFGLILGIVLTVCGVFVLDQREARQEQRLVNWDVVGTKLGETTKEAERLWSDMTREVTGP